MRRNGGKPRIMKNCKDRVKQRLGQFENQELGKLTRIEDKRLGGLDGIDGIEELGVPDRIEDEGPRRLNQIERSLSKHLSKLHRGGQKNRTSLPRSEGRKRRLILPSPG